MVSSNLSSFGPELFPSGCAVGALLLGMLILRSSENIWVVFLNLSNMTYYVSALLVDILLEPNELKICFYSKQCCSVI